jgi:hypothetical protein
MDPQLGASPGHSTGTPNCVLCSREQQHAVCEILRLIEGQWVIVQQPRNAALASTHQPLDQSDATSIVPWHRCGEARRLQPHAN